MLKYDVKDTIFLYIFKGTINFRNRIAINAILFTQFSVLCYKGLRFYSPDGFSVLGYYYGGVALDCIFH